MEDAEENKATKDHCKYCFDVIISYLQKKEIPPYPSHLPKFQTPLFVTWHVNGDQLRGCVGTFLNQDIQKNLPKQAMTAAFDDQRFPPIVLTEVPKLNVAVSLLVHFREAMNPLDWEIGKHGVIIKIMDQYNATFLPEVAFDQGWNHKTTLEHLIRKAGYMGTLESCIDKIKLTTYESSKFKLDYSEYIKMKDALIIK